MVVVMERVLEGIKMMFTNHFRTRSTTVGGGAEGEKFGFSASATFKGALETLHQDNRTLAEV